MISETRALIKNNNILLIYMNEQPLMYYIDFNPVK